MSNARQHESEAVSLTAQMCQPQTSRSGAVRGWPLQKQRNADACSLARRARPNISARTRIAGTSKGGSLRAAATLCCGYALSQTILRRSLSLSLALSLYTDLVGVGKGRMLAPCQLRLRGRGRQHGSFDVGSALRAPVRAADERVADALRRQVQVVEVRAHPRPSCVIPGQQYIPPPTSSTAILMHHDESLPR